MEQEKIHNLSNWNLATIFPKNICAMGRGEHSTLQVVSFSLAIHISHAPFKTDGEDIIFSKI